MTEKHEPKKLLVLGGASQHCKVVEAAHELGIKVYVADYLEHAPAKSMADERYLIDINDIDGLVNLCEREHIDGAISTSLDACQIPYQKVCERMKFPCFGTEKQFYCLTNKKAFKQLCEDNGVDTIPSYSIDDVKNDREVEYPIFIKPVDSRGSRGQSICYRKMEALSAIEYAKQFSSNGDIVIERCMKDLQDFTVSYFCNNGEILLVRTGDRFEGDIGSGLENLCIASCSPSRFTDMYIDKINEKVIKMIKKLGIKNGPVFFQGFIDSDTVYFYDPGLRFAGGEYERLLRKSTGIDIIKALVKYAIFGEMDILDVSDPLCYLKGKRIIQLDPTLSPGTISKIEGIEEILNLPGVQYVSRRVDVGDMIRKTNDLRQRFGEICVLSDSVESQNSIVKRIQTLLRVTDERGENMIFNPFDITRIEVY